MTSCSSAWLLVRLFHACVRPVFSSALTPNHLHVPPNGLTALLPMQATRRTQTPPVPSRSRRYLALPRPMTLQAFQ